MANVSLKVHGPSDKPIEDPAKIENGTNPVALVVTVTGGDANATYTGALKHDDKPADTAVTFTDATGRARLGKMSEGLAGKWEVTVTGPGDTAVGTDTVTIGLAPVAGGDGQGPPEPPGVYDKRFTIGTGIVAMIVAVAFVAGFAIVLAGRKKSEVQAVWILAFALLFLGVIIAIIGAWLVAIEVRGKLRAADTPTTRGAIDLGDAATLVEAVGKLRGSTAVLLLAAVCLIGSAWIGYGSTRPDSPATPPAETPATTVP